MTMDRTALDAGAAAGAASFETLAFGKLLGMRRNVYPRSTSP